MRSSSGPDSFAAVARQLIVAAAARADRVAAEPARARVGGRDQREARRERHRARPRASTTTRAVLDRLAQRLDRVAAELGQLVEEQHAAVREARLAGPQHGRAAAEQPGRADRVVRRSERAALGAALAGQQPRHGMQLRGLERLVTRERRAGSRRAGERASSCRRPASRPAAGCVRPRPRPPARGAPGAARGRRRGRRRAPARPVDRRWRCVVGRLPAAAEEADGAARAARPGTTRDPADLRGLDRVGLGDDARSGTARGRPRSRSRGCPASTGPLRGSDSSPARTHARQPVDGTCAVAASTLDGDRQVEARALLAEVPGGEVDDDAPQRPLETGVLDRRPDALAGVLHRRARQPGHDQRRAAHGRRTPRP